MKARYALALGLAILSVPASAGLDEGLDALNRGDPAAALRELRPLAERGDGVAQYNLGLMYLAGNGLTRDPRAACDWFEKAAVQNVPIAMHNMAACFAQGVGRNRDVASATAWYERAAGQGYVKSLCALGQLYLDEGQAEKGAEFCRQGAEKDSVEAQTALGILYLMGRGVAKDAKRGGEWLAKAAKAGHPAAQHNIGLMYRNGDGVPRDDEAAVIWLERAANQGYAESQYALGRLFFQDMVIPEQQAIRANVAAAAYYWLSLAALNLAHEESRRLAEEARAHLRGLLPLDLRLQAEKAVLGWTPKAGTP